MKEKTFVWFHLYSRFKEKLLPNIPRLTNVSLQHDSLSPEFSPRGISIRFHDLISLLWSFQSPLGLISV